MMFWMGVLCGGGLGLSIMASVVLFTDHYYVATAIGIVLVVFWILWLSAINVWRRKP